jgi:hypothetical protein
VVDEGGGDEHRGAGGEINDQLDLFQVELAAGRVVKVTSTADPAEAMQNIEEVGMFIGCDAGSEIESCRGEKRVGEVVPEPVVVFKEKPKVIGEIAP